MQYLKSVNNNTLLIIFVHLIICLLFVPYIWYGEASKIVVYDNLDSTLVWLKMVIESGQTFKMGGQVEQIMNGLPTSSLYGCYDISMLLFYCFGIFKGYVIAKFLMMIIAFWGMYFLLTRHIVKQTNYRWILIIVSFLFCILPFWSFACHVAGLPFVFFAFLNLRNKNTAFYNWLILGVFAFWSSIVLSGFFVLFLFSVIWLYDLITKKTWGIPLFCGLALLTCCYIISHLPLFYTHFFASSDYQSIRLEFDRSQQLSIATAFDNLFIQLFSNGDKVTYYHVVSNHAIMLIPIFGALLLMIFSRKVNKLFVLLIIYCFCTSVYYTIYDTSTFYSVQKFIWSIFPLDTLRLFWFNSFFWYIIMAIALVYIAENIKFGKYIILIFIILQSITSIKHTDYLYYREFPIKYRDFIAQEQFKDIKETIGRPLNTYKVASLGLEPCISQYNGFYTIDGFSVDYPLSYKREFRKIIEKELPEKGGNGFDQWGARAYLFGKGVMYNYGNERDSIQDELLFNYDQMKLMGAEYIISAHKLNLDANKNLLLIKEFPKSIYQNNGRGAYYDLYLYKIK